MIRVYINPTYPPETREEGGIRRVVEAMVRYLPLHDVVVAGAPQEADLIVNHGTYNMRQPETPTVSCCHGLYWHDYAWPMWADEANYRIVEALRTADAVTAPSRWVARAIGRGLLVQPETIYHGVDVDVWTPAAAPDSYILWNKARVDAVSDPTPVFELARRLPHHLFVTTFNPPNTPTSSPNVRVTGPLPHTHMREVVSRAGVYLATTRETFGIGTLEALACGVPVVGWDFGGQSEIVIPGETGVLVPEGDYDALAYAIERVLQKRSNMSAAARADAVTRWGWAPRIQQYADLFHRVVARHRKLSAAPRVSVIVTCYNLGRFLPDCLASVASQTFSDLECVVVDDCSTDDSWDVAQSLTMQLGPQFRVVSTPENVGLSQARNYGFQHAQGRYVLFLDADDMLDPAAVAVLHDALSRRDDLHIVYGSIDLVDEDGSNRRGGVWPPDQPFSWFEQMAHRNQMPYCVLMRREVMERSGGYRTRDWRAEDAAFWCRVTSLGMYAERVTNRATLIYRLRSDSKSQRENRQYPDRDGDWTAWFPWRAGRRTPLLVPFGAQGRPDPPFRSWPVRHHQEPAVSVIIPVGPGHEAYVADALDSLVAQTVPSWEAVVVDDTGNVGSGLDVSPWPFVRLVTTAGGLGAGHARNLGVKYSRAPLLLFLDADDFLSPDALEHMLHQYALHGGYIYSDFYLLEGLRARWDLDRVVVPVADYDRAMFLGSGYHPDRPGRHGVTCLIARSDFDWVGGFDEQLPFWEDWELFLKLAVEGVCGHRVPKPLYTYRLTSGSRRRASYQREPELREVLRQRFEPHLAWLGGDMSCHCGSGGEMVQAQARRAWEEVQTRTATATAAPDNVAGVQEAATVRLKYVGTFTAPVLFRGRVTRAKYYAGLDTPVVDVFYPDVEDLLATGHFEVYRQPALKPMEGEGEGTAPHAVGGMFQWSSR